MTSIDLDTISLLENDNLSETGTINFSCGAHFLEKVEDTKDSVWLVQVLQIGAPRNGRRKISNFRWKHLIKHLSRFGIQAGIFNCILDPEQVIQRLFNHNLFFIYSYFKCRFCDKKGWIKDEIILAMPEGYCSKDKVTMKPYRGSQMEPMAVFNWINSELSVRVQKVSSVSELMKHWLMYDDMVHGNHSNLTKHDNCQEYVRVFLLSSLMVPPMFFSALSVKFSGRVKFGIIDNESKEKQEMVELITTKVLHEAGTIDSLKIRTSYFFATPEEVRRFGSKHGEHYNYKSLFSSLQSMHPEANDVFKFSLIIISVASCFDFVFFSHLSLYKIVIGALWSLFKWNLILIFCWMAMLGIFCTFQQADVVLDALLLVVRTISSSDPFNQLRSDWLYYLQTRNGWVVPFTTFSVFYLLVFIAHKQLFALFRSTSSPTQPSSIFWNFGFWETQISNLLQPLFTTSSRHAGTDMDYDDDHSSDYDMMEMFIERLAMPDLWLRPIISLQYLHDLPIWRYTGHRANSTLSNESDCSEEIEEAMPHFDDSSATELNFSSQPYLFICEKCRAALHPSKRKVASRNKCKEARDRQASLRITSLQAAKYLMDGNYKCMCRHAEQGTEGGESLDDEASYVSHFQEEKIREHRKWTKTNDVSDYQNGNVPKGIIMASECSICLDSYKRKDMLCGLPCGHAYHQNCIMGWLTRDNHCCPVCRWPAYKAKPCRKHILSD